MPSSPHDTTSDTDRSSARDTPLESVPDAALDRLDRATVLIRPTGDAVTTETIVDSFRRLHRTLTTLSDPDATVEWFIATTGRDERVEYGLRCAPAHLDRIRRLARDLYPNEYVFETKAPDWVTLLDRAHSRDTLDQTEKGSSKEANTDPTIHGMEVLGRPNRRRDWQTALKPFAEFRSDDRVRLPLNSVVETLAAASVPAVFHVTLAPVSDWSKTKARRRLDLELSEDTLSQRVASYFWTTKFTRADSPRGGEGGDGDLESRSREYRHLGESSRRRLDLLARRDATVCFDASVHGFAIAASASDVSDAELLLEELGAAFAPLSGAFYETRTRLLSASRTADRCTAALAGRVPRQGWVRDRFGRRRRLVIDPTELGALCLLDGAALSGTASRALRVIPGEQAALTRPPTDQLDPYLQAGLTLGTPLDQDGHAGTEAIALPPGLQPLHVGWIGKTGSGKSTALVNAILANHDATDGADILIDPKGDGMPMTYLRAHFATYGTLENVYYFDCTELLPALPFFDLRPGVAAGLDRGQLVQDLVDHYIEILIGIMGRERFEQAARSPDIIRYLVKAQFDPVHGFDAFSHEMLQYATRRLRETRTPPSVSDSDLEMKLDGVATNSTRSFDELMQGVANRIEKATRDDRLNRLFNHVPDRDGDPDVDERADDPVFDFIDLLDRDCVILFDTGGFRSESKRVFTLVLLSKLWTALRRRAHARTEADVEGAAPLVNLYLEEAATVATSGLLSDLLAQSRGFGLSVTLAMQFPAQLRAVDSGVYYELLNNVSTLVVGNVSVDRDLAERLATEDMSATSVGTRLRALRRGQWFVSLPAPFGRPDPRPFLLQSAPLPPGHVDRDDALSESIAASFEPVANACSQRTRLEYGIAAVSGDEPADAIGRPADTNGYQTRAVRLDSTLPYTKQFPDYLTYDADAHALVCRACTTRFEPTLEGMRSALACCDTLDRVDRDSVPLCDVRVTLSPEEREASGYSDEQLLFLQAVYRAHRRAFDPELEYDLLSDSMRRLEEYTGVDSDAVDRLIEDDLLSHDGNHPHKLYTVTAAGRSVLDIDHREGVAYGDGVGDLNESSLHVLMVETGRRYLERKYVDPPDSPAVEAVSYHEVDGSRLDAVALDASGQIVAVLEAECSNNDTREAVPADYDKMALHNPREAVWLVPDPATGHEVLDALNDPISGPQRVETEYSASIPPQRFELDALGCSSILPISVIRREL